MSLAPLKKPRTPKAYKRAAVQAALDTMALGPLEDWLRSRAGYSNIGIAEQIFYLTRVRVSGECVRLWVKKLPQVES